MFGARLPFAPLLALVVFAASAAVVWLAYVDAGEMATVRQPPLVKAASTPLKRSPENEGGQVVADLGGVGDLLNEQPVDAEEKLLPRPEQPVAPGEAGSGTPGGTDRDPDERRKAEAAIEALVSEVESDDAADANTGAGGPNPDDSVRFPAPERPVASTDATPPVERTATRPSNRDDTLETAGQQTEETAVANLSTAFEATTGGRFRVQLAAVREEKDAQRAWELFREQLGPFIVGLQPFFERADTSNGVFYRVQVGPFDETAEADRLCVELKKQNASCFVVSR